MSLTCVNSVSHLIRKQRVQATWNPFSVPPGGLPGGRVTRLPGPHLVACYCQGHQCKNHDTVVCVSVEEMCQHVATVGIPRVREQGIQDAGSGEPCGAGLMGGTGDLAGVSTQDVLAVLAEGAPKHDAE